MKFLRAFALVSLTSLCFAATSQAKVWEATNTWDERWEDQFSEWVRNDLQEEVFTRGTYAGISTDCADAIYAMRIIFSYENQLPFTTSGSLSNSMSNFDRHSAGTSRVKAFIRHVGSNTGTYSLISDTYPIEISREALKPGVVWLRSSVVSRNPLFRLFAQDVSRHTEIVKEVNASGVIYLMGSTVPEKVRNLMVSTSLMYAPDNANLGFRRFLWPQNYKQGRSQSPHFSLEQFQMSGRGKPSLNEFSGNLRARLATRDETQLEKLTRMSKDLCAMTQLRQEIVEDALKRLRRNPSCMREDEYDEYSTPSRDKRMKESLKELFDAAGVRYTLAPKANKVAKVMSFFDSCRPLELSDGSRVPIAQVLTSLAKRDFSSDPNQNELARWGLAGHQKICR